MAKLGRTGGTAAAAAAGAHPPAPFCPGAVACFGTLCCMPLRPYTLLLPRLQLIPFLIGRAGATKRRVEEDTGASLAFPPRSASQVGTPVAARKAWWPVQR